MQITICNYIFFMSVFFSIIFDTESRRKETMTLYLEQGILEMEECLAGI